MSQWSIALRINEETQEVAIEFVPQKLTPSQYGFVLASVMLHLAAGFEESNPGIEHATIMAEILNGVQAGLAQIPPRAPVSQH